MATPFYTEWTFHVLTGVLAAGAGILGHRAWIRRRWAQPPAGVVHEAVLAIDLVDSTRLATHYGDRLAMRARNFLQEVLQHAGHAHGVIFFEDTGDGCMMTFPSVEAAAAAALEAHRGLLRRPAQLAEDAPLEARAAIAWGVILLDANHHRHGATINRAFRLMTVAPAAFVRVEGEAQLSPIPDRGRLFLDEASMGELPRGDARLRQVGVCRLKGFDGFHRVFELREEER